MRESARARLRAREEGRARGREREITHARDIEIQQVRESDSSRLAGRSCVNEREREREREQERGRIPVRHSLCCNTLQHTVTHCNTLYIYIGTLSLMNAFLLSVRCLVDDSQVYARESERKSEKER